MRFLCRYSCKARMITANMSDGQHCGSGDRSVGRQAYHTLTRRDVAVPFNRDNRWLAAIDTTPATPRHNVRCFSLRRGGAQLSRRFVGDGRKSGRLLGSLVLSRALCQASDYCALRGRVDQTIAPVLVSCATTKLTTSGATCPGGLRESMDNIVTTRIFLRADLHLLSSS